MLNPGTKVGHYSVVEKIGAGAMGEVYRARDQRLERDVAIKVLPAGTLADESARKRFRKEALTLSKLNHPHIATVHDFDTQEGVDFLVMEYVAGETLAAKLKSGPLPEKETAKLGGQVAEALEEAHEHKVIHRDLKPGNIALTAKGQVKVLDFGIAKLLRSEKEAVEATTESFPDTQTFAGTLPYMAPEQVRGEAVDARTDIHALGAVLYEMATGQRAFPDRQPAQLTAAIQQLPVSSPRALNRRVSGELERVVLKCLEKEPENRYQSAKELTVDLRRITDRTAAAITPSPQAPAWGKRAWRLAGVGLAVVALVAVLVGLNVGGLRDRLLGGVAPGQITSIAVLPLDNMMGDAEQDYFVEGMHEALITELSRIGALKVISRTSAMRYKDSDKPVPEIARELGVDALIEGSVLRAGDRVRVTAQLVDAATDEHLWAENFDRDLGDILALHSEVARAIAREIKIAVTPEEETRLAATRPVNPEAHEAYLKGRYHYNKLTTDEVRKGIEYFQQAIENDPSYAPAYAGLADCYTRLWDLHRIPINEGLPKAMAAALKALQLDDTLAEGHSSLGHIKWDSGDSSGAEQEFKRAIELNPGYVQAHYFYANYLRYAQRYEEALAEIKRALELDPLSLPVNAGLAIVFHYSRRYDEAIGQCQKTLELDPNFGFARLILGRAYVQKRMYEEAIGELQKAATLSGNSPGELTWLGYAYGVAGKKMEGMKILDELKQRSEREYVSPMDIAQIHVGLGEKDQALAWLEKAYEENPVAALGLPRIAPEFDSLRSDPRFQELLRRKNFSEN